jgi:CRP-like cAMP-binding protein
VYNCAVARASTDVLRKVPLFSGLDDRELQEIAAQMRERTFAAGDTVTQEGAGGAGFFIVESGEADVSVGGEQRGTIGAGDYFGEIALVRNVPRTATVRAKTAARLLALERDEFVAAVTGHAPSADAADAVVRRRLGGVRAALGTG